MQELNNSNQVTVTYEHNHNPKTYPFGMREMQARVFEHRQQQYLLLKSPPASGKSRALMFVALDKMLKQGIKKTIVAVPEKSISGSFKSTNLKESGFFANWKVLEKNNLCAKSSDTTHNFKRFLNSDDQILICTHSTLRNVFQDFSTQDLPSAFNNCLIAIDEFHHASSNEENVLGAVVEKLMDHTNAHIFAMTGTYFRGDSIAVLDPSYENRFHHITYNYYEQLNNYLYLKTIGIAYRFYQGSYLDDLMKVLDTDKKTIIHIPHRNSRERVGNKYHEVEQILDLMGTIIDDIDAKNIDPVAYEAGIYFIKREDGKILKVADLVDDDPTKREKTQQYLRDIKKPEDMDIIIALNMAKEGFDWAFCEHALTIGHRGSMTEIIQILGRCTRDAPNKTYAQFTNLIISPNVSDELLTDSVNNMLKAITASLLMEQILSPRLHFRAKNTDEKSTASDTQTNLKDGEIKIKGFAEPSEKARAVVENNWTELQEAIYTDEYIQQGILGNVDPEVINKLAIARVIQEKFPDLSEDEVEEVRQQIVASIAISPNRIETKVNEDGTESSFIKMAHTAFNLDDLEIDLIDQVNIFHTVFEVVSKNITPEVLEKIKGEFVVKNEIPMTEEEAILLFQERRIEKFYKEHQRRPSLTSTDPLEKRFAMALQFLEKERAKHGV